VTTTHFFAPRPSPYYPLGFHPHPPDPIYQRLSTAIGATMWFWILYRFKEDGGVLLGLHKPWEAHDPSPPSKIENEYAKPLHS
jgi:hypothetical protein